MFVFEDPGQARTERDRYFQRSRINSHLATRLHARRRANKSAIPPHTKKPNWERAAGLKPSVETRHTPLRKSTCLLIDTGAAYEASTNNDELVSFDEQIVGGTSKMVILPGLLWADSGCSQEKRSLRFFKEKTAYEWSGYTDFRFWDQLVMQMSHCEPAVRHAAVSIGAFHELANIHSGTTHRQRQQHFALRQSNLALSQLNADHTNMSACSLLTAYVIISTMMLCFSDMSFTRVQQMEFELFDQILDHPRLVSLAQMAYITEYLEPLISRQRSKAGYYIEISRGLRIAPSWCFESENPLVIPEKFSSIQHARNTLETLLNWTAYTIKNKPSEPGELPCQAPIYLELFLFSLQEYRENTILSAREALRTKLLRVAANMNLMMTRLIHISLNDLMIFDKFTTEFTELTDVFEEVVNFTEADTCKGLSFGIDSGILGFVGNSSRWCREPTLRRRMIASLWRSGRREAFEGAVVYAAVAEQAMKLEESGVEPAPKSAHDIPQSKRVKILDVRFWIMKIMIVRYATFPYGPDDFQEICLPHHGCGSILDNDNFADCMNTETPGVVLGEGYSSMLDFTTRARHITIKDPRFYFPIPSI